MTIPETYKPLPHWGKIYELTKLKEFLSKLHKFIKEDPDYLTDQELL